MKKIIVLLMLSGICRESFAQKKATADDKIFEMPQEFMISRYFIDLGKGNLLQIDATESEDIRNFTNIDSLLGNFFLDLKPFEDSLSDELAAKTIDYVSDHNGRKKIRIRNTKLPGSSFVIRQGEVSALKVEQDTLNMIFVINGAFKHGLHKVYNGDWYLRYRFIVNNINELRGADTKAIGEKITRFTGRYDWNYNKDGKYYMKGSDKSIYTKYPAGTINGSGDYLCTQFSAAIQNYKNYFVPSLSLGFEIVFNNRYVQNHVAIAWEPNFLFAKDATGKTQTYRNDFFTLSYRQTRIGEKPQRLALVYPDISLSRLRTARGDFYDKNTFRLGISRMEIQKGAINVEPGIFFSNFFKKVTPGVKLSVSF